MEPYERNISLRTIYLTLLRRIEVILLIFVPVALISFIVTNYGLKKQYTSSITVSRADNTNFTGAGMETLYGQITDAKLETVATNLQATAALTAGQIRSGLGHSAFPAATGVAQKFTITFTSTNSALPKPVLDEISKVALEDMQAVVANVALSPASSPSKTSKENTYFLIALAGGFVVACAIPFIYEIAADQVYDKKDLTLWGAEGFELKASK